jgi:cytochrome b561
MSLKLYRPGPEGLEPTPVELRTWRSRLRSRRWKAAPLANPEMEPTSSRMAVLFWLALAVLTFVVLLVGHGLGIWG